MLLLTGGLGMESEGKQASMGSDYVYGIAFMRFS